MQQILQCKGNKTKTMKTAVVVTSKTKKWVPILSTVFFKGVCFSPPINPRQVGASQQQTWATFLQNRVKKDIRVHFRLHRSCGSAHTNSKKFENTNFYLPFGLLSTLFKAEEFENAGFSLYVHGWETFCVKMKLFQNDVAMSLI